MRRSLSRTQTLRLVQQEGVAANFFSKESKKHNQATLAKEGGRYSVESIISNTLPWFLQPNRRRVALLWKSKCHAACPTQQLASVPAIQALPAIWRLFPDREVQAFTHKRTDYTGKIENDCKSISASFLSNLSNTDCFLHPASTMTSKYSPAHILNVDSARTKST